MKNTKKYIYGLIFLLCVSSTWAQMQDYQYKREILGIKETWHSLILPNEIFGKMRPDFSDIRILGITAKNDTIEAPYLLQNTRETKVEKDIPFQIINSTYNENGYYFTFEMPTVNPTNQIILDVSENNFDWKVKVEGSQNQNEWFTIMDNYRILGIENAQTHYKFTQIAFPTAQYRYFRLCIKANTKPTIIAAKISKQAMNTGTYRHYALKNIKTHLDKKTKETIIEAELPTAVPVSYLKFAVSNTFDYYRPIKIEYLVDSVKTEKGYVYQFQPMGTGTLTSLEKNEIKFENVVCQKLKISIDNADNEPLTIDSVSIKGSPDKIVVRFTQEASYYLVYGNAQAVQAHYDIGVFQDKIPANLTEISLGEEQKIDKQASKTVEPLFKNKLWLWGIMIVIILLLGAFSFKMLKNK